MNYIAYYANGKIQQSGSCSFDLLHLQGAANTIKLEVPSPLEPNNFYVKDGEVLPKSASPTLNHTFNWDTKEWEDLRSRSAIVAAQAVLIKELRDYKLTSGGYPVNGKWFHSDLKSASQQLGLVRKADAAEAKGLPMNVAFAGKAFDGKLYWKTMDKSFVPMTPDLANAIFNSCENIQGDIFVAAEKHLSAMKSATTPEAYDFTVGWPLVFTDIP